MQTVKLLGPVKRGDKIFTTEIEADDEQLAELRALGLVDETPQDPIEGADASVLPSAEIEANLRAELERQVSELTQRVADLTEANAGLARHLEETRAVLAKANEAAANHRATAEALRSQIDAAAEAKAKAPKASAK